MNLITLPRKSMPLADAADNTMGVDWYRWARDITLQVLRGVGMNEINKPLFTAHYASSSETTEYIATGVRATIDKLSGFNVGTVAVDVTVKLIPAKQAADTWNIVEIHSIAAGVAYDFAGVEGHTLESGGAISISASLGSAVVIRASGRESV